jgi:hypothetical protein
MREDRVAIYGQKERVMGKIELLIADGDSAIREMMGDFQGKRIFCVSCGRWGGTHEVSWGGKN